MKINKLLAAVTACSLMLSASAMVANASVNQGLELEYVQNGSSATTKVVNVYAVADVIWEYSLTIDVPNEVTDVTHSYVLTHGDAGEELDGLATTKYNKDGVYFLGKFASFDDITIGGKRLIATLTFTVPENTGDFNVSVNTEKSYIMDNTENYITLDPCTITIPGAKPAEVTVDAEKLAEGVANDYEVDGKIYKYTPFKATIDFASQTIKGAKVGDIDVPLTKISNIPTEITGSATVGIIVKSLDTQTVGAVKLIIE